MAKYRFKCLYCAFEWEKTFYSIMEDNDISCEKCYDSNVKKMKIKEEDSDQFGYRLDRFFKKKDSKK